MLTIGKEAQKRGAAHGHFVLGCESALELQAARAFRRHLERLSSHRRYEFGHVNGKFVKPKDARQAAAYLSSYFVRGRGHKAQLTEAVTNGELPRLPLYVSRRLTAVTRTTMRNKRRQRHLHVCRSRGLAKPPWWRTSGNGRTCSRCLCRCGIGCGGSRSSGGLSCRSCRAFAPRAAPRTGATGQHRRLAQVCLQLDWSCRDDPGLGASPSTRPSRASSTAPLRTEHRAP